MRKYIQKHLPNRIEDFLDLILKIIFVAIILIGAYILYDKIYVYSHDAGGSLVYSSKQEILEQMEQDYPDAIAWIHIEETLDEPVMQGKDNMEYLNKGPDGAYSLRGSIYLDSRNKASMADPYLLLYGHHMAYHQMFGALDLYLEETYWTEEHTTGTLILKDGTEYSFQIFAIGSIDASVSEIFQPTEHTQEDVLKCMMDPVNTEINKMKEIRDLEGKQILALSTCQTPDSTLRTCVFAVLENPNDHAKEK